MGSSMSPFSPLTRPTCFKYKDLASLAKEGDYMTTINLKDGFFHVPVLPSPQAYMSFQ